MSSLEEARRKVEERRAQQQAGGNSQNLWFRENDLVLSHFLCTGQDDDPYFEVYVAHEYPAKAQGGWPKLVYCPVESGHDMNYPCEGCKDGIKLKDRMMMWFWVYDIMHSTLKPNETLPQVMYQNKPYFRREVNGPKLWETSAWRESPLDDILMLGNQLGNLQSIMMQLTTTGNGLTKRFKIYTIPGTGPIDPSFVEQAKGSIRPCVDILRETLVTVPIVENPNGAQQYQPAPQAAPPPIQAYAPPGSAASSGPVSEYTPPTGPVAPKPAAKGGKGKKDLF